MRFFSYPRSLVVSLFAGFLTLAVSALVLILRSIGWPVAKVDMVIRNAWARTIFRLSGVSVEVRGAENLPPGPQGYLVLFNHTSLADIIAMYGYFPRAVRFGAKKELFRVPFFGRAMLAMGSIPIDRRYREQVLKLYEAAIPRVARGEAFALAPEGTRQREPQIGKFKQGPFLFAVQAQMNIVPLVIAGAFDVMPKSSVLINMDRFRRKIILQILDPVSTKGLGEADIETIQTKMHDQMVLVLERLKAELFSDQTTFVKNL